MANEFIIKNGFHSKGDSQVTGSLNVSSTLTVNGSAVGAAFPFTGDAQITGSLTVSGSFIPHGKGPTSNVIIGNLAGDSITSGGVNNVYIGQEAGEAASSGDSNVAIGWKAGEASNNDSNCILIGFKAGGAGTLGNHNIFVGYEAGRDAASTHGSIGIGSYALHESDTGGGSGYNTALGYAAGYSITSGNYNLFLGHHAGYDITTGANNIIIGSGSKGEVGTTNQLRIGHSNLTVISASLATGQAIGKWQRSIHNHPTDFSISGSEYIGGYNIVGGNVTCSIATGSMNPGAEFEFFQTSSAGNMLFVTASAAMNVIVKNDNLNLAGQGSGASLKYISGTTFHLVGDLT